MPCFARTGAPAWTRRRPAGPTLAASTVSELSAALRQALDAFDEPAAQAVLDRLLSDLSLTTVLRDVVLPYLAELGERWQHGTASIAQEHFASNIIRGRLAGLARGWGGGHGPRAVLACPPGEQHDMGLMIFGIVLNRSGWRIDYLGTSTPVEELERAVEATRPDLVVLAATLPETLEPLQPEARRARPASPARPRRSRRHAADRERRGSAAHGGRPGDRGRTGRVVAVKVLVAGASGFVGRRLCPALAETAYYLVHTLSDAGFEHNDGAAALSGEAGVQAWLQRSIYLGGSANSCLAWLAHGWRALRQPATWAMIAPTTACET